MAKQRQGDTLFGRVRRDEIGNLPGPHPFGKSLSLQFLAPSHDATFPGHPILAVWAYPPYILFSSPCQVNSETTSPIRIQRPPYHYHISLTDNCPFCIFNS